MFKAEFWQDPVMVLGTIIVTVVLLYLARKQAHQVIKGASRVMNNAFRMAARSVMLAEASLRRRNKEVLLAEGLREVERELEREFHRVEATVKRDLQTYPAFHRSMSDMVTRIDEDYALSTDVPPTPPGWITAVEAVAKIPETADGGVANILRGIQNTLDTQHKAAMASYRKESATRHGLLKRMMPFWRDLTKTTEKVSKTITGLEERAKIIDSKMIEYEQIRSQSDVAERRLSSSSMVQFVIAGLVVAIAIGGAIINFNLIALPMSEMVGGGSYIGAFKTSDVAGLVIILVEVSMGLFLMESLRITRLFPIIGTMDDKMRTRLIWTSLTILVILAGVESALAFMRDEIAASNEALKQSLAGDAQLLESARSTIPTVGQMVLGFILPFALTFVAIPLESFIHSGRTVMGLLVMWLLRVLAFTLRFSGNIFHYIGRALVSGYDLLIFPLLWVENIVLHTRQQKGPVAAPKKEVNP